MWVFLVCIPLLPTLKRQRQKDHSSELSSAAQQVPSQSGPPCLKKKRMKERKIRVNVRQTSISPTPASSPFSFPLTSLPSFSSFPFLSRTCFTGVSYDYNEFPFSFPVPSSTAAHISQQSLSTSNPSAPLSTCASHFLRTSPLLHTALLGPQVQCCFQTGW